MTPKKEGLTTEELAYGKLASFQLPSGYNVTIREQNGNDDDIISNQATGKDLTNLSILISSLVIDTDLPIAKNGKLSIQAVRSMLLRDKYFILFASRIHTAGNIINFSYDWGEGKGGVVNYTDDLNNFIWDYNKSLPEQGTPEYYKYRILPYDHELAYKKQEYTLASGKNIRFNLLDGDSELYLLNLPLDQMTKNRELRARNLEEKVNGVWTKVENFVFYTKRDMVELNKFVSKVDPSFNSITELENPTTSEIVYFPIISAPDFFYPEEI